MPGWFAAVLCIAYLHVVIGVACGWRTLGTLYYGLVLLLFAFGGLVHEVLTLHYFRHGKTSPWFGVPATHFAKLIVFWRA